MKTLSQVKENEKSDENKNQLDSVLREAKRVVYRIVDYEKVFNICEGTSDVAYELHPSEQLFQSMSSAVQEELTRKNVILDVQMETTFPKSVNTHAELLKQVFSNLVSTLTLKAADTNVTLNVTGYQNEAGVEAILDLTCEETDLKQSDHD